MDIESRVIRVVAIGMRIREDEITADSTLDNLGAESLDKIEILMMIEDEFGVEIPDADAEKMMSVKNAVDYLSRRHESP